MTTILTHSTDYIWRFRTPILSFSLGIPAAIEGVALGAYLYKNPGEIKNRIVRAKALIMKSFTRQEAETSLQFRKRLLKNVLISLTVFLAFTGVIGATCVIPYFVLPSLLAIPATIIGIALVADLAINGQSYCKKWKTRWIQGKEWIKDAFTMREGESKEIARKRMVKNTLITVGATVLALTALGALASGFSYFIIYAIHAMNSGVVGLWNIYTLFPIHGKVGIFLTYVAVGALHGILAIYKWRKGDRLGALFHLACLALSFFFPIQYWKMATIDDPMRFHHSILGLLLQLCPFRALRFYGSLVVFDSGINTHFFQQDGMGNQYDYQNIFVSHLKKFVWTLAALSGIEFFVRRALPKTERALS